MNSGAVYIHGRDSKYRPLIVINLSKIHKKTKLLEDYSNLFCYLIEYSIENLMIPGKIENFVLITDLNKLNSSDLPKDELKRLYRVFEFYYKYRLAINYIVNVSTSVYFSLKFSNLFMNHTTAKRSKICKNNGEDLLLTVFAANQLEQKYGGKRLNAEVF